jgi:hypothetical protein
MREYIDPRRVYVAGSRREARPRRSWETPTPTSTPRSGCIRVSPAGAGIPVILFHGDRDITVNPRNADAVVAQSAQAAMLEKHAEEGQVRGGHASAAR